MNAEYQALGVKLTMANARIAALRAALAILREDMEWAMEHGFTDEANPRWAKLRSRMEVPEPALAAHPAEVCPACGGRKVRAYTPWSDVLCSVCEKPAGPSDTERLDKLIALARVTAKPGPPVLSAIATGRDAIDEIIAAAQWIVDERPGWKYEAVAATQPAEKAKPFSVAKICAGCSVREPWEHRCFGSDQCDCEPCLELNSTECYCRAAPDGNDDGPCGYCKRRELRRGLAAQPAEEPADGS